METIAKKRSPFAYPQKGFLVNQLTQIFDSTLSQCRIIVGSGNVFINIFKVTYNTIYLA